MILYGLKNCDSCKKAHKEMIGEGYEVQFIDVRIDGVDSEKISVFFEKFGKALVNTRSTTWRGLSESQRAEPELELLAQFPTLMKRPVIDHEGNLTLGWSKDVQQIYL